VICENSSRRRGADVAYIQCISSSPAGVKVHMDGLEAIIKRRGGLEAMSSNIIAWKFIFWYVLVPSLHLTPTQTNPPSLQGRRLRCRRPKSQTALHLPHYNRRRRHESHYGTPRQNPRDQRTLKPNAAQCRVSSFIPSNPGHRRNVVLGSGTSRFHVKGKRQDVDSDSEWLQTRPVAPDATSVCMTSRESGVEFYSFLQWITTDKNPKSKGRKEKSSLEDKTITAPH
jgi:hypothetical protein